MLSSSMVVTTSTNGTCATMAAVILRAHVRDRRHQQPAGAAAHGEDLGRRRIAPGDQIMGDVDEVVE